MKGLVVCCQVIYVGCSELTVFRGTVSILLRNFRRRIDRHSTIQSANPFLLFILPFVYASSHPRRHIRTQWLLYRFQCESI